ncbi:chromosome-anchoring protein RacA [Evansella caseinilytica]|uniref:Chromosome-anchoring protein RacA n=1 Tax=Evansella caseinilytica TaxID=1503961 RepID=A0A1H3NIW2_9BACI|nr:MerR family transcriptional regulator [Evansella caseinilytica]SDY88724.1 chromosome-anchoring protein RacA [Evansella caseinilytica]
MENAWKTKDVATELGVTQKTIRRWINHFQLKCDVNEKGHYLINEDMHRKLVDIHKQLEAGKTLQMVSPEALEKATQANGRMVSSRQLDDRFSKLLLQIDQLDRKLQGKASEVVEIQMFQHRQEIDELTGELEKLTHRLEYLEKIINEKAEKVVMLQSRAQAMDKSRRKRFANIFSF